METNLLLNKPRFTYDDNYDINFQRKRVSFRSTGFNPAIVNMVGEAGINFYSYLKNIGLSKEPDLMILSSKHHYYCDGEELKSVKTLINLKKLNLIKHLDMFLFTLIRILPQDANFIGCFSDSKALKGSAFPFYKPLRLFNRFINFLDSSSDHNIVNIINLTIYETIRNTRNITKTSCSITTRSKRNTNICISFYK